MSQTRSFKIYLHFICAVLLLIGGLNWGLIGMFDYNLVEDINSKTFQSKVFSEIIYTVVGLCAVYLLMQREFYLPFLGHAVVPESLLQNHELPFKPTIEVEVDVVSGANKVMFWAANPSEPLPTTAKYDVAYGKFGNSGVVEVVGGKAKMVLACPQQYWVPKWGMERTLYKHVHYREVFEDGFVGEVKTVDLTGVCSQ